MPDTTPKIQTQGADSISAAGQAAGPASMSASQKAMESGLETIGRDYKEKATLEKAKELGLSYVNLSKTIINPDLLRILEPETAARAKIMPFFRIGMRLRVAVIDPQNPETVKVINDLKKQKFLININLCSEEALNSALKLYESEQYKVKKKIEAKYEESKVKAYELELTEIAGIKEKIESVSAEEGLELINIGAMKTGASDIHYEPEEKEVRVRFRIDGVLHNVLTLDKKTFYNISNQLKYISKMKLNVTNIPQDGRFSFILNERKIDVRVSAIPTQFGESFVCRLLDPARSLLNFQDIGFEGDYLAKMERLKTMSHGMILCTGPTGSGKTTMLYTILDQLNSPENKIITLEDPVEYNLHGIVQSPIDEKRNFTFAEGLRAILRQDPDVVMIGEIRDLDTAHTASQAALTGHVVLSTLHTNSAIETISRLLNMGLPAFMIAPSLHTIIAQRLVRRICDDCKVLKSIPTSMLADIRANVEAIKKIKPGTQIEIPDKLPFPAGCDKCSHTGYKGRIAVSEIITLDYEIRDMILKGQSSNNILLAARRKGLISMREDGILKVLKGLTTIEEVYRVTSLGI
ncbi:type II/IV secretion system protein [Candidatus Peregrinibacteria bacterium]|nr:type II/IV secretion system protein [Candidatus Peregrinibacteria bacterium]